MMHRIFCALGAIALTACGPASDSGGGNQEPVACSGSETRCEGDEFFTCDGEELVLTDTCDGGQSCDPSTGCTGGNGSCTPGTSICVGTQVVACDADGAPGDVIESCPDACQNGVCTDGTSTGNTCGDDASQFIYVVDNANTLYRFEPANDANRFERIGNLDCDPAPSLDPNRGTATPFSMSVDRDATAWVLYSSGEIFHVSTDSATCTKTAFVPQQQDYDVFGMGFVSDSPGSTEERLYVSGSKFASGGQLSNTKIGFIDTTTLAVNHLQDLSSAENPPELTGTGDAKLYGYFPGSSSYITELDKTTGQPAGQQWNAGSFPSPRGWAFAQWGGRFYVFITTPEFLGDTSRVIRVDPATDQFETVAEDTFGNDAVPYIVGAGVSTCAPVVVE